MAERMDEREDGEVCCKEISLTLVNSLLLNSILLWLLIKDLHKIGSANVLSQKEEGVIGHTPP